MADIVAPRHPALQKSYPALPRPHLRETGDNAPQGAQRARPRRPRRRRGVLAPPTSLRCSQNDPATSPTLRQRSPPLRFQPGTAARSKPPLPHPKTVRPLQPHQARAPRQYALYPSQPAQYCAVPLDPRSSHDPEGPVPRSDSTGPTGERQATKVVRLTRDHGPGSRYARTFRRE